MATKEAVMEALRNCFDPEIGINVVDLGLIYQVKVEGKKAYVEMTMTTPGCPLHAYLTQDARQKVLGVESIEEAEVKLVWDPPWSPSRMSMEAKRALGFSG